MPPTMSFKGPGHWRSQADAARQPANVYAQLAESARLLSDMGQGEAQQHVHAAEAALQGGDALTAANELRAAARSAGPEAKAEGDGLRVIADKLSGELPGPPGTASPDDDSPMAGQSAMQD